jgi:RNA polymerase sigma-32 factor
VIEMNRRLSGGDASLNATVGSAMAAARSGRTGWKTKTATRPRHYAEKDELDTRRALLAQALVGAERPRKDVLMQRRLADEPVTLEDLSESYGVSRERIRQIEVRAFEKLQARMRDLAKGKGMVVPA